MYLPSFNNIFAMVLMGTTIIAAPSGPIVGARSNIDIEKRAEFVCLSSGYSDFVRAAFFLQKTTAYSSTELAKAVAPITISPLFAQTPGLDIALGTAFLGIFGKVITSCAASLSLENKDCVKLQDAAIVETDLDFMESQGGPFVPVLKSKRETVTTVNPVVQNLVDKVAPDAVSTKVAEFLKIDLKIIATLEAIEFSSFIEAVKAYCDAA
ncbi:hypothetical protein H072_16 [Dactylellina haptotyla CBS 200.50]|uniref:Uncharacterized protein n=1 Tax=Dactylellina haptotyla (strain CBS 200.50) TaxID=1284197 RepID=S8AYA5_DACHA|nr:hypothetical protein H072_16 [Dactylellina haptotyla CBS 200.50]